MRTRFAAGGDRANGAERASVLVIVMVTLLFAAFALLTFTEKAMTDLLVEQRESEDRRLRREAYSALEVTLAVLEDFRAAGNGLRSPAEGWSDPLGFAGYVPSENRTVEIAFEDESGKISLPRVNVVQLSALFENWEMAPSEAADLADALMSWMHKNHVSTSPQLPEYDRSAIPFETPGRPLRSFEELRAIERVREVFFDPEGRPNEYWQRFVDSVSLLDFQRANLNGARPDTLAALGQFDLTQQQNLADFLSGAGIYQYQGPGFFQNPNEAQRIAGPAGDTRGFGTTISALRIMVTVREGRSSFQLAATIAPPNGATSVQTNATSQRTERSAGAAQAAAQEQNQQQKQASQRQKGAGSGTSRNQENAAEGDLKYPFTLLEIRENDRSAPARAAAPAE